MHTAERTFAAPLSPQTFYILLALADKPCHGYAIMERATEDSAGSVIIPSGTLYTALARLTDQRLIALHPIRSRPIAGKPRQYYRITDLGRDRLNLERQRLERAVIVARQKLLGPASWSVK